jgi:glycerol-3-phosphate acyltransferase PlsX
MVAGATLHLTRLKGVKRPGIAVPFPTQDGGICLVIDVGANIYCKPIHLFHYAYMASAYAGAVLGVDHPRVGILNIGEEEEKGTSLVKETGALLRGSSLNFVGNIEGHAIFKGGVDVVVCEGFVGNIVLKTMEGLAESILTILSGAVKQAAQSEPAAAHALKAVVGGLKSRMDYAAYGGAPLLGFEGVVLIGHGRSSPEAVASAVRTATEFALKDVNAGIRDAVKASRVHAPEGE